MGTKKKNTNEVAVVPDTAGAQPPRVVAPPLKAGEARAACVAALVAQKREVIEAASKDVDDAQEALSEWYMRAGDGIVEWVQQVLEAAGYKTPPDALGVRVVIGKTYRTEELYLSVYADHPRLDGMDLRVDRALRDFPAAVKKTGERLGRACFEAVANQNKVEGELRKWIASVLGRPLYRTDVSTDLERACARAVRDAVKEKTVAARVTAALETEEGKAWALDTLKVLGLGE